MTTTANYPAMGLHRPATDTKGLIDKLFSLIGIRSLLFISLFLIAAIPVSILSVWVERSAIEKEILAVSEKHLIVAKNLSIALSRYVTDVELFFGIFADESTPFRFFEGYDERLEKLHLKYIVTLGAGDEVLAKINAAPGQNIKLPNKGLLDHLRGVANAAGGAVTISGIKQFLGSPHFFVLKALSPGKLALAPLAPTYVIKVQKAIAFGKRGHSMIVDHQGRVVAHPNSEWQATSKNAAKLSVVKKMITGNTGVMQFYSPPMKADMISGYTYVPETGWGVMVPQPMSELIERARDVQAVALVIAASLIGVAIILSWWLSKLLACPVLAVVKAAQKISRGQLNAHVEEMPAHAPVEMKVLGTTFNSMVDDLQNKTRELSGALIKAEEGSRTKSQFLAMMSHEIRTPMNGILGVLELLEGTSLDKEQNKFVSVARNSGNSLIQVISDILDFSKLEAGKLEVRAAPFDVSNTIEEVSYLFKPVANQKLITLGSITTGHMPETLISDSRRLRQILFNLLGNAVKFTDKGGVIVHSTYIDEGEGNGTLKITVMDTGIGIPTNMHARLFEDFAQCDASYSRKYGGTGLGLSISMRLIELMNGEISFTSTPGKGSTFLISLPVKNEMI